MTRSFQSEIAKQQKAPFVGEICKNGEEYKGKIF